MADIKLCIECAHYHARSTFHDCLMGVIPTVNVVTGEVTYVGAMNCETERLGISPCGPDGKNWQKKA